MSEWSAKVDNAIIHFEMEIKQIKQRLDNQHSATDEILHRLKAIEDRLRSLSR